MIIFDNHVIKIVKFIFYVDKILKLHETDKILSEPFNAAVSIHLNPFDNKIV